MLTFDPPQLVAGGVAILTVPFLMVAHRVLRRYGWGLPAAALVQGGAWWLICAFLLPRGLTLGAADWLAGAALLGALWLAWFWIYSTLCRGFSLQLLVEIEAGARRQEELAKGYAEGRGIDWLLEKRLRGLSGGSLVQRGEADSGGAKITASASGRALGRLATIYKRLVGIGAGG